MCVTYKGYELFCKIGATPIIPGKGANTLLPVRRKFMPTCTWINLQDEAANI